MGCKVLSCAEKYATYPDCINDCRNYMKNTFLRKYLSGFAEIFIFQSWSILEKYSKYLFKITFMTSNLNENTGVQHVMVFESKKTQKFIK